MRMKEMKRLRVYEITREYGGPEEGGWWYSRHTEIFTGKPATYRLAKKALKVYLETIDEPFTITFRNHNAMGVETPEKSLLIVIHSNEHGSLATLEKPFYC